MNAIPRLMSVEAETKFMEFLYKIANIYSQTA